MRVNFKKGIIGTFHCLCLIYYCEVLSSRLRETIVEIGVTTCSALITDLVTGTYLKILFLPEIS